MNTLLDNANPYYVVCMVAVITYEVVWYFLMYINRK